MCLEKSGTELQVEAVRLHVPTTGFVPSLLRSKICLLITESTTTSLSVFWFDDVPQHSLFTLQRLSEFTYEEFSLLFYQCVFFSFKANFLVIELREKKNQQMMHPVENKAKEVATKTLF